MANVTITQLPAAGSITGAELVPIVQNGQTVRTTASAIAGSPSQTQTFITKNQEPTLPNSRALSAGTGIGLVDGGAQSTYQIALNAVSGSLEIMTSGIAVNVSGTMTAREIEVSGSGLSITDGDGQSGNPTLALTGTVASLANNGGTGFLALPGNGTVSGRTLTGTTDQIDITNGSGASGNPVFSIASNPALPGTASVTIPVGSTAQRPTGADGMLRYNSDLGLFEGYLSGGWQTLSTGGSGVTSIATGAGLTGGPITTTGTISVDTAVVATTSNTLTMTGKTLVSPVITDYLTFLGPNLSSYSPFANSIAAFADDVNAYNSVYTVNLNNGSDASADFVAYNDASDVNSYFIDLGINSSNFSSATYPIFPANSGYLITGGGASNQAADLYMGTSNVNSDIVLFTGGFDSANKRVTIKGSNGNVLVGTTSDGGQGFQVGGTAHITGAASFGSTVTLSADPTLALQAATKQYVDAATSSGFTVHAAVNLATAAALPSNTYNNGTAGVGATLTGASNGALTVDGVAVSVGNRILVKDEVTQANNGVYAVTVAGDGSTAYVLTRATDFDQAAAGEIANNSYFFVLAGSVNAGSSYILSVTGAITVGTTALTFTQFSDQLNYVGGTNIDVTGLTISLTGTVAPTNGGTGVNTVATGDLLYGSGTDTWSKLSLGIAHKSLVVNASGTQIEWNAVALNQATAVSGQLGVSNGGTSFSGYTTGDMIYASGSTALAKLNIGTSGYVVTSSGTAPQWTDPSSLSVGTAANATNAVNVGTTVTGTNANFYVPFVSAASTSNQALGVDAGLTYNPSTNAITSGISGGTF